MIKIKELTNYLQNHGFKYLKKLKGIVTNCKALYLFQNEEVIIRFSILGYYPKGYQLRIDFYSIYQMLDDSILSYETDEYDYGSGYIFSKIFYDAPEIINFIDKQLADIDKINTSTRLLNTLKKLYKHNQSNFEIEANDLIITLNIKLNNYEEVIKGYQTLIDINDIIINKLKKEEYFKCYYSKNKDYAKYKNSPIIYDTEEMMNFTAFKNYNENSIINLLTNENKVYDEYIDLIRNKQYGILRKKLKTNKNNNIKKLADN